MNELIRISPQKIGAEEIQAVDGRELHGFLEVQTDFCDWMLRRIKEYGFIGDIDFSSNLRKSPGGRPLKEYALSLDMAKELAMVEKTEKGRMARRYFIACEKQLKAVKAHREIPERRMQHQYFAIAAMCKTLDKYLGGIATARALQYFTGMPTDDLVEKIQGKINARDALYPVRRFVSERCAVDPVLWVEKQKLYGMYVDFCARTRQALISKEKFFKELYAAYDSISTSKKNIHGFRVPVATGIGLT
jgi:phage anti-repressor protein